MDEYISKRQYSILKYIVDFLRHKGESPSIREIMKGAGLASTGATAYQLNQLVDKGYIKKSRHFRNITVASNPLDESPVVPGTKLLRIVASGVPAGPLKPIPELIDGTCLMDQRFFRRKSEEDLFLLKVTGDSMKGAGIDIGDWVLVRPQETADPGDLVIAAIDNEFTLKRFKLERGEVVLEPANSAHSSIRVPKDKQKDFRILGRVIKAVKDFE